MSEWDILPYSKEPIRCNHCGQPTIMKIVAEKKITEILYYYDLPDSSMWTKWQVLKCSLCEKINVIESSATGYDDEVVGTDIDGNDILEEQVKTDVLFPAVDLPSNPNTEKLLDVIDIPDDFYKKLIDEVNYLYRYGFVFSLSVLVRKLLENLLIDILRKKYGNLGLSLYYDTSKHRFLEFSILIENFKSKQVDFQHVTSNLDSKLISEINSYRETGNSGAHSIDVKMKIEYFKNKRDDLNYLVQFLFRLLKNISP